MTNVDEILFHVMKYTAIIFTVLLLCVSSTYAQTIVLEGEQTINSDTQTPILTCTPIKITKSMKISSAKGDCKGFWIQKGSETIHRFDNFFDPIGTALSPGTYYVYPYLKKDTKKADISVTLKAYNSG